MLISLSQKGILNSLSVIDSGMDRSKPSWANGTEEVFWGILKRNLLAVW